MFTRQLLPFVNTLTKYGSIQTYHALDSRGGVTDKTNVTLDDSDTLIFTEKVDGTNVRIIINESGDYVIGLREELIYARGDRAIDQSFGAVTIVEPYAERLVSAVDGLLVVYGELYGANIGQNGKEYSRQSGIASFRVFDVAHIPAKVLHKVTRSLDNGDTPSDVKIMCSQWREHGGQEFLRDGERNVYCIMSDLHQVPIVTFDREALTSPEATWRELGRHRDSLVTLSSDGLGRREGVVVRTPDRGKIAKIRHQSYDKSARQSDWKATTT